MPLRDRQAELTAIALRVAELPALDDRTDSEELLGYGLDGLLA